MPIDQLVRGVAAIAAVFYVVGFLTTNAYLYQLGVSDFSLLRTRFILTGVLALAPLVLALIMGVYAALDATAFVGEAWGRRKAYLSVLGDIAIPFVLYFVLFFVVAENGVVASARYAGALTVLCAAIVLMCMASLSFYRKSGRRPLQRVFYRGERVAFARFNERYGIPETAVETLVFVVGATILFLAYIGLFGQVFYPIIPEQLGGGKPRTVQLLVAADAVPAARELGIEVSEETPLSPPLQLLWEGEETYAIRLPRPHQRAVVQIDRALIDGVVTGEVLALPPDANA
jgi:hypothetical protein